MAVNAMRHDARFAFRSWTGCVSCDADNVSAQCDLSIETELAPTLSRWNIMPSITRRANARMKPLIGFDPNDVVAEVLRGVRLRGSIFCRSTLRAPWGFSVRPRQAAAIHFVAGGACQLEVEGAEAAIRLAPRDLVVLPNGNAHTVRDAPGSPARWLDELLAALRRCAHSFVTLLCLRVFGWLR